MLKWKRGLYGRPETTDGRFYIQGHWDVKPGYYELVDTKTNRREDGRKIKDLKALAETMSAPAPASDWVDDQYK